MRHLFLLFIALTLLAGVATAQRVVSGVIKDSLELLYRVLP